MTLRLPETMTLPPYSGSFSLYDESVLLGQVTRLGFIGASVEATLSGTFGYVTITTSPGGGGGAGIMGWDDGVPLGTGTILDARNRLTMTRSGSVLTLDADVFVPGVDQIGVFIRDDGVARGTGTTLDFRGGITAQFTGGYVYIDVGLTTGMQRTILVGSDVGGLTFLATGVGATSATYFNTIPIWGLYGNVKWSYDGPGTPAQGGGTLYLLIPFLSTGSIVLSDEGGILGSAIHLNVRGTRAQLTLSGTYGTLDISPDPMDNIGIMAWDEGIPIGTGTILNAIGAGITLSRSGSIIELNVPGGGAGPVPGTGTIVAWDEGVLEGSFPIIDFGNNLDVTFSGSVLRVNAQTGGGTSTGTFDRDLPSSAWYPSSDAAGFASARAQVKQSTGSVPSPRFIEWLFHPALNEYLVLEMAVPRNFIDTPRLVVDAKMASGTSGLIEWGARAFVRGPGGTIDADGSVYQAAVMGTGMVPAVAGREFRATIALLMTGTVAGDRLNILLYRNATGTPDTGGGDAEFVGADFTYSGY